MTNVDRAVFVAAYSRLVADVWADPAKEQALDRDPRGFLAGYGLHLPEEVQVRVVRDVADADPDLEVQVKSWELAESSGAFVLFVPSLLPVAEAELAEDELDSVVAGLDSSCACCCPCCCT
ncbi:MULTISPECIES: hypothetical protein [Micromonospora]|uniref:hypothetical protein n=1 Tax=Micromonospora TaxID=1873 RepID=UPI0003EEBC16|nr:MULTISPECIES: hypothetical protein [Micromonospora]EWM66218.1 hypothetical protein MCBG_03351 [Micromonospora sp. M42]MBC8988580.1 hypothetical protein [Micromonospora chalcea]MBQ1060870.1 hypothetical protein [Micromonospora sp. C41]MCK1805085.1 hypothetical protein [Micromonospora sp. R42106]MCK1829959.1 hypothetical protein [Micromonospora sp. R42003]